VNNWAVRKVEYDVVGVVDVVDEDGSGLYETRLQDF
jgi:hypothetical protein